MTTREFLEAHEFPACVYCQSARATQREHVVPKSMRRRHHIDANDARFHVPACMPCNLRKATYKFYPRGFDVSLLPGTKWREWDGDPAMLRGAA